MGIKMVDSDYSLTTVGALIDSVCHPIQYARALFFLCVTVTMGMKVSPDVFNCATKGEAEEQIKEILKEGGFDMDRAYVCQRISGTMDYEVMQLRWRWPWLARFCPPHFLVIF